MADNVAITAGAGTTVAADEVIDATLGTVKVQYVKIMDATLDGTAKAGVGANGLEVDASAAASAFADGWDVTQGAKADAAWTTGAGSVIALLKAIAGQAISTAPMGVFAAGREYEFVAASSADQPLGAAGAVGDTLDSLIIVPLTTSPGEVKIKDGTAGTYRTIFLGGATSVGDLKPFEIGLSLKSLAAGGWIINTGANVQVFAAGDFS